MAPVTERPKLRPDVVLRRMTTREETYAVAKEPDEQKYLKFEDWEYDILVLMDGSRTPGGILSDFIAKHPGLGADEQFMADFIDGIRSLGLLERTEQERHLAMMDRLKESRKKRFYDAEKSTIFQILIPFWDPDRVFDRLMAWIRWWWSPWFVGVWMVVFTIVLGFLVKHWDLYWAGFFEMLNPTTKTIWDWIGLFALVFVVSVWHELGHGLTCKRYGGEVHSIGIMIFYLQPAFYCGIDDSYMFPNRFHRMYVAFGGSYFELMLCSIAMPLWLLTPAEWWIHGLAMTTIFFSGLSLIAFNLNPLIKLDGYYVLMDWLDVPNLREESFEHIGNLLKRHILRLETPEVPISRRRRRIYLVYGICSLAYTALVFALLYFFALDYLLSWFGPAGYLVLLVGIAFAFRRRLGQTAGFVRHLWLDKKDLLLSPSGGAVAAAAIVVIALLLTLPRMATRIGGSFTVEPGERAVIRAPADGMVRDVRVEEGTRVSPGEILAVLDNPDLLAERDRAASDLIRSRREAALARRENDAARALELEREVDEAGARLSLLDKRAAALSLASPIGGVVVTPYLEERAGLHLSEGELFCSVDRLDTVRLAVSASERDIDEVEPGVEARIRLNAYPGRTFSSRVLSISPEATSAAEEGQDAVDLVRRSRLVRVLVEMDNAGGELRPGMTGRVQFLTHPRSLAGIAWWRFHRWAASVVW